MKFEVRKINQLIKGLFKKEFEPTTTQINFAQSELYAGQKVMERIPYFGKLSFKQQKKLLYKSIFPLAGVAVTSLIVAITTSNFNSNRVEAATQLQMLSQRLARLTAQTATGNVSAFKELEDTVTNIKENVNKLRDGRGLMPGVSGSAKESFTPVLEHWDAIEPKVSDISSNKENLIKLRKNVEYIQRSTSSSIDILNKIRTFMLQVGDSKTHQAIAESLSILISDANKISNTLLSSIIIPEDAPSTLTRTATVSLANINSLLNGDTNHGIVSVENNSQRGRLSDLYATMSLYSDDNDVLTKNLPSVIKAKNAAQDIINTSERFLLITDKLTKEIKSDTLLVNSFYLLSILLTIISICVGFMYSWLSLIEQKIQSTQIEDSIMFLMNDMGNIADGDLTVKAQVTEDITGTIADSLNFTVANLNNTLSIIKHASEKVNNASQLTKEKSESMRNAILSQSKQIQDAFISINNITGSIQNVAENTGQSEVIATEQVKATREGKLAVQNAINAMESIREQIQETSKRIKRLGEGSQEIGEIVELISDTTEQTSVLALNASIQAAAAGEAGRGFRAVATEVQRLAERSEASLKRIVALIRTIQTDTQNAISSMEKTTEQVVEGAQVTNKAGAALLKIELVSTKLSLLIKSISDVTKLQNSEASVISDRMAEILAIAQSTTDDIDDATKDMLWITSLSEELENTVLKFKL